MHHTQKAGCLLKHSAFYYGKENPRLGLGFRKAFSVVLKKLFRDARIFLVRQPTYQHTEEFLCQKTLIV